MLTFDLTPLARRFDCLPALEAARGKDLSRVGWQFLGAMLREMPDAEMKAVVDPVIAGMDRLARGEDWPEAAAAWAAAWAAARAAQTARTGLPVTVHAEHAGLLAAAEAAEWAAWAAAESARAAAARAAAEWANDAGLPYARQREILMRLIEEATDAERTDR